MKGYNFVACVALAALVALGAPAKADWIDTFDGDLQSWSFGGLNAFLQPVTTVSPSIVSSTLQLTDATAPNLGGAAVAFGYQAELFTDVRISAILNPGKASNLNSDVGLLARADLATFNTYSATADFTGTDVSVDLSKTVNKSTSNLIPGQTISGYSSANSVYLEFSVIGSSLEAKYYDAPGGTLLATLSATDAALASGAAGVVVSINESMIGTSVLGTWDTVGAQTVPEPAEILMLLSGGAVLGLIAVRRRRR